MNTERTTATIVGVLYIVGTVAGFLSMVVTGGLLDAPDYLNVVAANASRTMLGALLVLVMGLALAMVPAMMFPILKRQNEALAIGYVVFRGALETVTYIASVIGSLLLVPVSQAYLQAGVSDASSFQALGTLLLKARETSTTMTEIVFPLGALMFYYVLYQARLVPRWISGWGIVAGIAYLSAGLIAVFSTNLVPLLLPMALQEMVMAVWLIARGFSRSAIPSLSVQTN
ncbi:MAG TPA: DUF4386 domain-containing protein [Chloroflexota bacterium]|nr:DUF4386 domain-containing protein [Chloroflexota bacterium]